MIGYIKVAIMYQVKELCCDQMIEAIIKIKDQ